MNHRNDDSLYLEDLHVGQRVTSGLYEKDGQHEMFESFRDNAETVLHLKLFFISFTHPREFLSIPERADILGRDSESQTLLKPASSVE